MQGCKTDALPVTSDLWWPIHTCKSLLEVANVKQRACTQGPKQREIMGGPCTSKPALNQLFPTNSNQFPHDVSPTSTQLGWASFVLKRNTRIGNVQKEFVCFLNAIQDLILKRDSPKISFPSLCRMWLWSLHWAGRSNEGVWIFCKCWAHKKESKWK